MYWKWIKQNLVLNLFWVHLNLNIFESLGSIWGIKSWHFPFHFGNEISSRPFKHEILQHHLSNTSKTNKHLQKNDNRGRYCSNHAFTMRYIHLTFTICYRHFQRHMEPEELTKTSCEPFHMGIEGKNYNAVWRHKLDNTATIE